VSTTKDIKRQQRISMLRAMFQMSMADKQEELANAKKLEIDDPSLIL
jgi:hypothetical protein